MSALELRISHPDKELFPGITKRDLAGYYERVGRVMVKNRPEHFPDVRKPDRIVFEKRGNRIFVDVLRNRCAQHAVPPYAARPGAEAALEPGPKRL